MLDGVKRYESVLIASLPGLTTVVSVQMVEASRTSITDAVVREAFKTLLKVLGKSRDLILLICTVVRAPVDDGLSRGSRRANPVTPFEAVVGRDQVPNRDSIILSIHCSSRNSEFISEFNSEFLLRASASNG